MDKSLDELNLKIEKIKTQSGSNIIGFVGFNSFKYIKLMMLFIINGAVVMPLSPFSIKSTINNQLRISECNTLVYSSEINKSDLFVKNIIPIDYFKEIEVIDISYLIELLHEKMQNSLIEFSNIIFTSGSTGNLKAVMHTFKNHYLSASGSNLNISFEKNDRWLISLPLNHIGGFSIIMRAAVSKASFCVKNKDEEILETIKREKPSHVSLTPSQLLKILNGKNKENMSSLKSLKAILVGGAKASSDTIEKSYENNLNVYFSYGLTETASQVSCTPKNCSIDKLKTSGKLLKHRELKINSDKEILVRGGVLFNGIYLDNNSKINVLDKEGWFATGDIGFMDKDGYLNIIGRKDLMFNYRGEKIFPEEIEEAVKSIKEIEEVYVVALEDEIDGHIPAAFIKSRFYESLNLEKIKTLLEKRIEKYKIPVFFFKLPEKENDILKPDRQALKLIAYEMIMSGSFMK